MEHQFSSLPVKVLQFGEGNFLRAFADDMIHRANEFGCFDGSIAIVKPRGNNPLPLFAANQNRYTVSVRGSDSQGVVEEDRYITSVRYAFNPNLEPELYQKLCLSHSLRFIISNTTEAGIHYDETDTPDSIPRTFPGRVTQLLYNRYLHFSGDESKGLYLLPCELIEHNGKALQQCVIRYARLWKLPEAFLTWMEQSCWFLDTLVDRIVSGYPQENAQSFFDRLGYEDPLLTVCEPFHMWAIEEKGNIRQEFPLDKCNSGVIFTPDVTPYKERKVRLLNGSHTAMTPIALLCGKECVDEVMNDPDLRPFLDQLHSCEIIPAYQGLPREELEDFAQAVKTRFSNPFLHHRWEAISLNSWSKFVARLLPTIQDSRETPQRIAFAFAALVQLYCSRDMNDDPRILEFFRENKDLPGTSLLDSICAEPLFGLSQLENTAFLASARFFLEQLRTVGVLACVRSFRRLIHICSQDNVAVAKQTIPPLTPLATQAGMCITREEIPTGHKVALTGICQGSTVYKYGCSIGIAAEDIPAGSHVHSHNLHSGLTGKEHFSYCPTATERIPEAAPDFMGYLRKNGKVGIRNEIWIIPTVGCVNGIAQQLAHLADLQKPDHIDAVVALTHPYGCSQLGQDHAATRQILANLASHPNAAGVLLLGLGCENNQLADLLPLVQQPNLATLVCQETENELEEGLALLQQLIANAETQRQKLSAQALVIGIKCGGSDAFSGITANPLVGKLSDSVCGFGGSILMGEVPEMFGAEQALFDRCESETVFRDALSMIQDFKDYYLSKNLPICENPSPGNRAGGITTLEEKSLGCTQKSGLSTITDALPYGAQRRTAGVSLLSTPGNDLVASTALAAAGCHMVLFTTGRGTPFGTCIPTVKISTNTALALKKKSWIDFDAGTLLQGDTIEELAGKLKDYVLCVASGQQTKNELLNDRQIAIFKNGVTL